MTQAIFHTGGAFDPEQYELEHEVGSLGVLSSPAMSDNLLASITLEANFTALSINIDKIIKMLAANTKLLRTSAKEDIAKAIAKLEEISKDFEGGA